MHAVAPGDTRVILRPNPFYFLTASFGSQVIDLLALDAYTLQSVSDLKAFRPVKGIACVHGAHHHRGRHSFLCFSAQACRRALSAWRTGWLRRYGLFRLTLWVTARLMPDLWGHLPDCPSILGSCEHGSCLLFPIGCRPCDCLSMFTQISLLGRVYGMCHTVYRGCVAYVFPKVVSKYFDLW